MDNRIDLSGFVLLGLLPEEYKSIETQGGDRKFSVGSAQNFFNALLNALKKSGRDEITRLFGQETHISTGKYFSVDMEFLGTVENGFPEAIFDGTQKIRETYLPGGCKYIYNLLDYRCIVYNWVKTNYIYIYDKLRIGGGRYAVSDLVRIFLDVYAYTSRIYSEVFDVYYKGVNPDNAMSLAKIHSVKLNKGVFAIYSKYSEYAKLYPELDIVFDRSDINPILKRLCQNGFDGTPFIKAVKKNWVGLNKLFNSILK